MKKLILFVLVLASALLLAPQARAQFTSVTGTVVDPNGIPYAGGSVSATLTPGSSSGFRLSGQPYSGQVGPATLDATGTFTLNMGSNALITPASTQWKFTVNSNPGGIPLPLGTGAQTFVVTLTISGASQNISTQLQAAAPKLTNFAGSGGSISITATGPIVVTPSPLTGTGVISCPACVTGPGGSPTQLQFNNTVFGGVAGSAVNASTGAITLTPGADTTVGVTVTSASTTRTVPLQIIKVGGDTNCAADTAALCIGTGAVGNNIDLYSTNGDGPNINFINGNGGSGGIELLPNIMEIFGNGTDGNSGYIQMGNCGFAPFVSQLCLYSIDWTYFGTNANQTWKAGINAATGEVISGWLGLKVGEVSFSGFGFSIVDGVQANKVTITNPGTDSASYNFVLPITPGTAGQVLTSQGGGTTPMTWTAAGGGVSGLTTGFLPKAASATTLTNSLCDEAITTANTFTCSDTQGMTLSGGPLRVTAAGAASKSQITITGTLFTGGSGTTTFPSLYINQGTAPTNLSTAGTEFGINAPSGFTGNMIDLKLNGASTSSFTVSALGATTVAGLLTGSSGANFSGSVQAGSASFFGWTSTTFMSSPSSGIILLQNSALNNFTRLDMGGTTSSFAALQLNGTNLQAELADGSAQTGFSSSKFSTETNCSNAASPAVCGSASSGVVAVPTGTNPTLTINTSAVTANSRFFLTIDESATIAATTCNTTLATLLQPVVTARIPGTSFTIQVPATLAVNPACVSYLVFN